MKSFSFSGNHFINSHNMHCLIIYSCYTRNKIQIRWELRVKKKKNFVQYDPGIPTQLNVNFIVILYNNIYFWTKFLCIYDNNIAFTYKIGRNVKNLYKK